jgi:hypothetical protein
MYSRFKDPLGKVDSARIPLQAQKDGPGRRRTVHTARVSRRRTESRGLLQRRLERLQTSEMIAVDVAQEAGEWRAMIRMPTKVVNCPC